MKWLLLAGMLFSGCYTTLGTAPEAVRAPASSADTLAPRALTRPASRTIVHGSAGAGITGDTGGLAFAGGVGSQRGRLLVSGGFDIIMGSAGGNSRYYTDRFSNGQSRCRDSATGRFASSSSCAGSVSMTGGLDVDLNYAMRHAEGTPFFGLGYRLAQSHGPYVSAGYLREPARGTALAIKAGVGSHLLLVTIGLLFQSR